MKPKKRKLSGKLLGVIQCLSQTYKQKLFVFFCRRVFFLQRLLYSFAVPKALMEKKTSPKSNMPIFIGDLSRWLFLYFFSTYHLSLAHSTVGEGTEALNCNSWWFLLGLFPRIFFKKLMIASFCWKRSHAFQRNENLLFIHCDVM